MENVQEIECSGVRKLRGNGILRQCSKTSFGNQLVVHWGYSRFRKTKTFLLELVVQVNHLALLQSMARLLVMACPTRADWVRLPLCGCSVLLQSQSRCSSCQADEHTPSDHHHAHETGMPAGIWHQVTRYLLNLEEQNLSLV